MAELYSIDELLEFAYSKLDNLKSNKTSKVNPIIETRNRKSYITNFNKFVTFLNRDIYHVQKFIDTELHITTSLKDNNELLCLNNRYQNHQILDILQNYLQKYVICPSKCSSLNTSIVTENRINFIICNSCKSKKSINI